MRAQWGTMQTKTSSDRSLEELEKYKDLPPNAIMNTYSSFLPGDTMVQPKKKRRGKKKYDLPKRPESVFARRDLVTYKPDMTSPSAVFPSMTVSRSAPTLRAKPPTRASTRQTSLEMPSPERIAPLHWSSTARLSSAPTAATRALSGMS